MAVRYEHTADGLTPADLEGFFEGWATTPSADDHLRLLRKSDEIVIARDGEAVVGFATAVTDGVLAAYIPLLEVRASHRRRGIGRELVRRLLDRLGDLYMVDLVCDEELVPFYQALGLEPLRAMGIRRHRA